MNKTRVHYIIFKNVNMFVARYVHRSGAIVEQQLTIAVLVVKEGPARVPVATVVILAVVPLSQIKILPVPSIQSMLEQEPIVSVVLEVQAGIHRTEMKQLFFLLMSFMKPMVLK
jgi:hypothetical protein